MVRFQHSAPLGGAGSAPILLSVWSRSSSIGVSGVTQCGSGSAPAAFHWCIGGCSGRSAGRCWRVGVRFEHRCAPLCLFAGCGVLMGCFIYSCVVVGHG